jgi:hypothetical protein
LPGRPATEKLALRGRQMGWMATVLNFICGLAGYDSCGALSTFEAIILAVVTLAAFTIGLAILVGLTSSSR